MSSIIGLPSRKTRSSLSSSEGVRDRAVTAPYSPRMRKLDDMPSDSPVLQWEPMFERYPSSTELGRELRRGVAEVWLRDLDAVEAEVPVWESLHAEIDDRIQRMLAESDLRMRCLVQLGATPDEFGAFRAVLEEVVIRGHLTISEAASLAHVRAQRNGGSSSGGESDLPSDPALPRGGR